MLVVESVRERSVQRHITRGQGNGGAIFGFGFLQLTQLSIRGSFHFVSGSGDPNDLLRLRNLIESGVRAMQFQIGKGSAESRASIVRLVLQRLIEVGDRGFGILQIILYVA